MPLLKSAVSGAWRFALVSLGGFGVWAGQKYFLPKGSGELLLYGACLVVFIGLAALLLPALVIDPEMRVRFTRSFVPAFVAYAVVWSALWFALQSRLGEWLGSIGGCAVFAWILGKRLGATTGFGSAILLLIVTHSAGYFMGSSVFYMGRNPPAFLSGLSRADVWTLAKFAWGLFYGLGFGAGIGGAYYFFQKPIAAEAQIQMDRPSAG